MARSVALIGRSDGLSPVKVYLSPRERDGAGVSGRPMTVVSIRGGRSPGQDAEQASFRLLMAASSFFSLGLASADAL